MARYIIAATLKAKAGRGDELIELLGELVPAVAGEEGTEQFVLHRANDDPDTIVFYEVYRDEEAYKTHRANPALGEVFGRMGDLLDGPASATFLTPVKAKGLAI